MIRKTIFYKHWFEAGVHNINDLLTSDSKLMTYSCFRNKWCPNVSFLNITEWFQLFGAHLRH